jgi:phage shock protein PspC (stress-responsive transcriptional regulator)
MTSLRLDSQNARWLGVCAGLARWLDVPPTLVRIVAIICTVAWPTLIIGYLVLYFIMDKQIQPDDVGRYFKNARTAEHFRQLNYRKPIYKNARDKRIAGVCAGIADYLEINHFVVRALTLLSLFLFGPFTVIAYIICAVAFDADPYAYKGRKRRGVRKSYSNEGLHESTKDDRYGDAVANEVEGRMSDMMRELDERVDEMLDDVSSALGAKREGSRRNKGEAAEAQRENNSRGRRFRNKAQAEKAGQTETAESARENRLQTAECYRTLELRLRDIEAYMTSSKFRLHCELNRI